MHYSLHVIVSCPSPSEDFFQTDERARYEMLDVVGDSLGSHLVGIASLLQTRQVHGDAGGMRGSCYWTWYRHEVWIALRTRRRLSLGETYWSPPPLDSFEHLPPEDIGNRVIFLLGQCIDLCNDDEGKLMATADEWLRDRSRRAAALEESLDDWKRKLPSRMLCYASTPSTSDQMELGVFGTTWFISPQSGESSHHQWPSLLMLTGLKPLQTRCFMRAKSCSIFTICSTGQRFMDGLAIRFFLSGRRWSHIGKRYFTRQIRTYPVRGAWFQVNACMLRDW